MNPAYTLALKLEIPVIVQPAWNECQKLREEGTKLREEGWELWNEGWKLQKKGLELYQKAVARELGPEYVDRIDWKTGKVRLQ